MGDTPFPVIGAIQVLESVRDHPLWRERLSVQANAGIGGALGHWPGGNEPAAALCRVSADGTVTVVTSAVDMSGAASGFALIAAEAFGVSPEIGRIVTADTASGP